jgi:hypothetical protein
MRNRFRNVPRARVGLRFRNESAEREARRGQGSLLGQQPTDWIGLGLGGRVDGLGVRASRVSKSVGSSRLEDPCGHPPT